MTTSLTAPAQTSGDLARITVNCQAKRLDLSVPVNLPVVEALPGIVRYLGQLSPEHSYAGYGLLRGDGQELAPELTFAAQNVADGDEFSLRLGSEAEPAKVYDDIVEAVGDAVATTSAPWSPADAAATAQGATVTMLAVTAVLLALGQPSVPALTLAACGTGLVAAAAAVLGRLGMTRGAGAMALTAALYGAVLGRMLGELFAPGWEWTMACAGLFGAGAICLATLTRAREVTLVPITVGIGLGGATLALQLVELPTYGVFAITAAVAGTLTNAIPWLAMSAMRIKAETPLSNSEIRRGGTPVDGAAVRRRFGQGQRVAIALRAAAMVIALVCVPFMVRGGVAASAEAVALFLGLMLSSRQAYSRLEVGLVGVVSIVGLGLTAFFAGQAHPEWRVTLAVALALAAAATAALTLFGRTAGAALRRIADGVSILALVSLLPLAIVVAGLA
ncbi:MAG: EsaB/YukD family protein [Bifidobacteriaceae bacterium]|jgi:hypothetical protein|nr:EsaB/YukD family protein [Bifidobacteriaceae bacterium]